MAWCKTARMRGQGTRRDQSFSDPFALVARVDGAPLDALLSLAPLEAFAAAPESLVLASLELDSLAFDSVLDESLDADDASESPDDFWPLVDDFDRESVLYQPLPLKTMPTGWMILRSVPPHCSQVVSRGSEKLWRFSTTSLQAVQV